jgi:hypothetical protein
MFFERFKDMLKNNSGKIAKEWAKGIMSNRFTKTYIKHSEKELIRRSKNVYDNLGNWLEGSIDMTEVGKIYVEIGKKRYKEGFPLCEVIYALHYIKKILWNYISSEGVLSSALEIYQIMGIMAKIHNFFDSAGFYLIRGYHEALYKKVSSKKGIDKKILEDIFPKGSFYYESGFEPDTFEKLMESINLFKVRS